MPSAGRRGGGPSFEACPPGSRRDVAGTCVPVGWRECGTRFRPDPSGWGCEPISPVDPCAVGSAPSCDPPTSPTCPDGIAGKGSDGAGLGVVGLKVVVVGITVTGFEPGAQVEAAGELELRESALVGNRRVGLLALDPGTKARLEASVVRGTLPNGSNKLGQGAAVGFGASLEIVDSVLADNHEIGVISLKAGSLAKLERSIVRDTRPRAGSETFGWGIAAQERGRVVVARSAVLGSRVAALNANGPGVEAIVEQSELSGTSVGRDGTSTLALGANIQNGALVVVRESTLAESAGFGLLAGSGGALEVERVTLLGNAGAGLQAEGAGTTVIAAGLVIRDTRLPKDDPIPGASGLVITSGATLELDGGLLEQNRGAALSVVDAGSTARVRRVLARDTLPVGDEYGFGFAVEAGASLHLTESASVGNRRAGIAATDTGTSVVATDVLLRGTLPNAKGERGRGCNAQFGASLSLLGSAIVESRQLGCFLFGAGTRGTFEGSLVSASRVDANGFGHGIGAVQDAAVLVSQSTVSQSEGVALIFAGASAMIAQTLIAANAIGAHAQEGSALVSRDDASRPPGPGEVVITSDTTFSGNDARLGSGRIPVPAPEPAAP